MVPEIKIKSQSCLIWDSIKPHYSAELLSCSVWLLTAKKHCPHAQNQEIALCVSWQGEAFRQPKTGIHEASKCRALTYFQTRSQLARLLIPMAEQTPVSCRGALHTRLKHSLADAVGKERDYLVRSWAAPLDPAPADLAMKTGEQDRGIQQWHPFCTGEKQLTEASAHIHFRSRTPSRTLFIALPVSDMESSVSTASALLLMAVLSTDSKWNPAHFSLPGISHWTGKNNKKKSPKPEHLQQAGCTTALLTKNKTGFRMIWIKGTDQFTAFPIYRGYQESCLALFCENNCTNKTHRNRYPQEGLWWQSGY